MHLPPLALGLAAACLVALTPTAAVAAPSSLDPSDTASSATERQVTVTAPVDGAVVDDGPVAVRGRLAGATGVSIAVTYVVDVSGSTAGSAGRDCNGVGGVDADDDLNGDGRVGDILDCEIAGVLSLNGALRAVPDSAQSIRVGVVGFGSDAAVAELNSDPAPDAPSESFVAPGDTRDDKDVIPKVNQVAGSLTVGQIGLQRFTPVGSGTNFDDAAVLAVTTLGEKYPDAARYVFFLSDGESSVSQATLDLIAGSGVRLRSFAVGLGADCSSGSSLQRMAAASSETCTTVTDPSALAANLTASTQDDLESVTVSAAGRSVEATVDAVGNFTAELPALPRGPHVLDVVARYTDGTTARSTRSFTVGAAYTHVALGDSFSSGEGNPPYGSGRPQFRGEPDEAFLCHRSDDGWPAQLRRNGIGAVLSSDPDVAHVNRACSGARLVNLDTAGQPKTLTRVGPGRDQQFTIPLQNTALNSSVDLVTFTFGGNDGGFVPIVFHCMTQANCKDDGFVRLKSGRDLTLAEFVDVRARLVGLELASAYRAVRAATSPGTRIVTATYPRLVATGSKPFCKEARLLGGSERDFLAQTVNRFDDIILAQAAAAGIEAVDVRDAFDGHAICDSDDHIAGIQRARAQDLDTVAANSAGSFHPNSKGVKDYADAINAHLSRDVATPLPIGVASAPRASRPQARLLAANTDLTAEEEQEVAGLAFTTSEVVDLAGALGRPSCPDRVVPGEVVPLGSNGFAPGTPVSARLTRESGTTDLGVLTAGADGAAEAVLVAPQLAAGATEEVLVLALTGTGVDGNEVRGYSSTVLVADSACASLVAAAGVLAGPNGLPAAAPELPVLGTLPAVEPGSGPALGSGPGSVPSAPAPASATPSPSVTPSPVPATSTVTPAPPAPAPVPVACSPLRLTSTGTALRADQAHPVALQGTPGARYVVTGYTQPSTALRLLRSGRLDAAGRAVVSLRPRANSRVFARVEGGCAEQTAVLLVQRSVSVADAVLVGQELRVSGAVTPGGRQPVSLWRRTPAGLVELARATTRPDGSYAFRRRLLGRPSALEVVVVSGQDAVAARGTSRAVRPRG